MPKETSGVWSISIRIIVTQALMLCLASGSLAGTIWESNDSLYSLNVIGFYHINVASESVVVAGELRSENGYQESRAVAHFSSRLGHRFSAFLETELTLKANKTDLRLERLMLKYDIDNSSQFSLGRFHSPVGFWNRYYHHGRWLQTTKDRPVQNAFGSEFLPKHYWGAMYERRFSLPSRTVNLVLGLGTGRDDEIRRVSPADPDSSIAYMAHFSVAPAKKRGLTFGGSWSSGDLKEFPSIGSPAVDEQILAAHIRFVGEYGEFLAEVSKVQHDAENLRTNNSYGSYLQYGHRLAALKVCNVERPRYFCRLQAYFRVDNLDLDTGDTVYSGLHSNEKGTVGLRYNLTDNSAVKLEVRHDRYPDLNLSDNSVQAQFSAYFD